MTARVQPLQPPYDEPIGTQLARMMPPGADPIGLFRKLVVNLPMTVAMNNWGRYELGRELSLSMRQREVVIDRTCARCGCEYEWGVHVMFFADRVGLTREQLTSITHGDAQDVCWTAPDEAALIRLVDSLHDHSDVNDELWSEIAQHLREEQLLDAMMLCGWYHAISFTARGFRVALEPGAPTFGDFATSR